MPAGLDYPLTLSQLRESHLITGVCSTHPEPWLVHRREYLLNQFERFARCLWDVGIEDIFIGGSFVEDKPAPNDIDGYFVCSNREVLFSGELSKQLDALSTDEMRQRQVWHWKQRVEDPKTGEKRLAMWHHYQVELIPTAPGLNNAIVDKESGKRLSISEAFRLTSFGNRPKGIIKLLKDEKKESVS